MQLSCMQSSLIFNFKFVRRHTIRFLYYTLLAILNSQGAFWGLMAGLFVGMIRMILDFSYVPPLCGEPDNRPAGIVKILSVHYLHFGIILFLLSCIVTIIVSLLTRPIDEKYVSIKDADTRCLLLTGRKAISC